MSNERPAHAPSFPAAKLWEKTSGKGTKYLSGRLGGVKIAILPRREGDGDPEDTSTHVLMFSEATPYQPREGQGRGQQAAAAQPSAPQAQPARKPASDRQRKVQVEDDAV